MPLQTPITELPCFPIYRFQIFRNIMHDIVTKAKVLTMLEFNVPVREIAAKVRLTEKAIYGIQRRHKENGTIHPKPKSGRPKKLTERDAREVVRTVRKDPRASLCD